MPPRRFSSTCSNLADEGLAVAVLVDRDLEEVVVDKLARAGLAAAAQLGDVVVARIAQLDIEGLVREHAVEHDLAVAGRPREAAAGIILQPVAIVVVDADGAVDIRRSGSASNYTSKVAEISTSEVPTV